jgi:nicotinamide riboside transporter PnuC
MSANRWLDRTQPQTLFMAVILLYINSVFLALSGLGSPLALVIAVGGVAAGYGIANEKKWGYGLGIVVAVAPLVQVFRQSIGTDLITLMFEIALVALLLHPQSREYQRIWFK